MVVAVIPLPNSASIFGALTESPTAPIKITLVTPSLVNSAMVSVPTVLTPDVKRIGAFNAVANGAAVNESTQLASKPEAKIAVEVPFGYSALAIALAVPNSSAPYSAVTPLGSVDVELVLVVVVVVVLVVVCAKAGTIGPNANAARATNEPADANETSFFDLFRVIPSL